MSRLPLSIAIPTFGRDSVLTDTIAALLAQEPGAAEILIVDQTPQHDAATEAQLSRWHAEGAIRWIRKREPSQPAALNVALTQATQTFVLMLDDDIRIEPGFLAAHLAAFRNDGDWMVIGQVLQPGETPLLERWTHSTGPLADLDFPFRSAHPASIENGMSGNMTVRRERALMLGGFDENFLPPVSYRFDTEFCKRLVRAGGQIRFAPDARIFHLRAERGGTRSVGSHLNSASPVHGVGDYYFALCQGWSWPMLRYILRRPLREVCTRFHLRRPWWIPVKLVGELRALLLALQLRSRGRRLPALQ
jgi:GT2 family glycosyltransferase